MKKYIFGNDNSSWSLYTNHIGDYMHRYIFKTPFKEIKIPFTKIKIPLANIRLHHILRSDWDIALHDHPFNFLTILLTGGYTEVLPTNDYNDNIKLVYRKLGSCRWVLASQPHRLILKKPVWTLVFAEKPRGMWGFYLGGFTKKHWISSQDYFKSFYK